ncbi:MAG: COQ9 family protein [Rhodospirillaceae bacterium]|nr:COQ9 family protein [Rhodospirillaceae bacterium]
MDTTALKDELLTAALPNIPFDGWSRHSLGYAAETVGVDPDVAAAAFPDGLGDLLAHFGDWADRQMLAAMEAAPEAGDDAGQRLLAALRARFDCLAPYKDAVRRAVALLALPVNAGISTRLMYRTVDALCLAAGDTATDFSFYTRRWLLAGVVGAATLYWLNDKSDDHEDTWAFLARRIGSMQAAERGLARAGSLGSLAEAPFRLAARLRARRADRHGTADA